MIEETETIGMVGVGLMGHGIALNIAKHGHPLLFFEHPGNQPTDDLLEQGAKRCTQLADIASAAKVIVLCVTGTPQVEDVLYRPDGLLAHLQSGAIVIDCSTAIPSSTVKIAADIARAHGRFLDAPMTRTPKEAAAGRLSLIIGGDEDLFEECQPLLATFAENMIYAGPAGAGHRMKLIHNFVSLGFAAVLAEAAACAERAGIDVKTMLDVLAFGGGSGVVLQRLSPYIESRDDSGLKFSLANAHKDLSYYTTMAEEAGAVRAIAASVRDTFAAGARTDPAASVPELVRLLGERRVSSEGRFVPAS